jgi:hypothetical protein
MFEQFRKMAQELLGENWEEELPQDGDEVMELGLPDDEITTWVDATAYGAKKYAALGAHASQGENIMFLQMGEERFIEFMGHETFVRVRDHTNAPLPETDLFDGLR